MAGGYGRGSGIPLRDRVRVDRPAAQAVAARADLPATPGRHCWVIAPVDAGEPRPGLLLRWEQRASGWTGEVVYLAQLRPGEWATVTEWVGSHMLSATPPTTDGSRAANPP